MVVQTAGKPAEETLGTQKTRVSDRGPLYEYRLIAPRVLKVMILPQVHLRKPCYDFYFL
jgi:hypothetical protein